MNICSRFKTLTAVVWHPILKNLPFILETPNNNAEYVVKITQLWELADDTLFFSKIKKFFQKPLDKIRKMVYYVDSALINMGAYCCVLQRKLEKVHCLYVNRTILLWWYADSRCKDLPQGFLCRFRPEATWPPADMYGANTKLKNASIAL